MRLTVVPSDKIIIKDGKEYKVTDLSYLDSNIHAIQWYDDKGEIEYVDGTSNLAITDITPYNQCVTDWEAAKTKEAEANVYTDEQWQNWFREIRDELLLDSDWMHTKQSVPYIQYLHKVQPVGSVKWIANSRHTGKDNVAWHLFSGQPKQDPDKFKFYSRGYHASDNNR